MDVAVPATPEITPAVTSVAPVLGTAASRMDRATTASTIAPTALPPPHRVAFIPPQAGALRPPPVSRGSARAVRSRAGGPLFRPSRVLPPEGLSPAVARARSAAGRQ